MKAFTIVSQHCLEADRVIVLPVDEMNHVLLLHADLKRSASPKRHGVGQPVIKITATSSSRELEPTLLYSATESLGAGIALQ
jgi:hypothetical protein